MDPPQHPDHEVLQFILERLESVPHLEALLLIWQNQGMTWSAVSLSARIYVSDSVARAILDDFARHGLVNAVAEGSYVYDRTWDAQRHILPRLADLYRRQLVEVTKLIHGKGSSSVREFARAFQIKKDP